MADIRTVDPSLLEPVMVTVFVVPTTGGTVTLTQQRRQIVLLNPAGTLATLTVNLPNTPNDGDIVRIGTAQTITLLTVGGGSNSVVGTLTTLLIGSYGAWIYNTSTTKWFRIG